MEWWSEERLRAVVERVLQGAAPEGVGAVSGGAPWTGSARLRADDAAMCADWMQAMKVAQLRYVGPFGDPGLTVGDWITVRAGSRVYSTMPKVPKVGKLTVRTKTVKVVRLSAGRVDRDGSQAVVRNPLVTWAGKGGYWCWCDANNVDRAPVRGRATGKAQQVVLGR